MSHASSDDIRLDFQRSERIGFDEAIFCQGKTVDHLTRILGLAQDKGAPLLLTRLAQAQLEGLSRPLRDAIDYEPVSRTGYFGAPKALQGPPRVAIVGAGTSDAHVTREIERTLRYSGIPCTHIVDVGAAGLWRLMERLEEIRAHPVVIVVAGMDAALPTVVGGLVGSILFAVPTSNGYGVAEGGHSALNAVLASCSPGIGVLNIDNGYGGACAAMRALRALDAR